jgi:hypothetical protein
LAHHLKLGAELRASCALAVVKRDVWQSFEAQIKERRRVNESFFSLVALRGGRLLSRRARRGACVAGVTLIVLQAVSGGARLVRVAVFLVCEVVRRACAELARGLTR